MYLYSGGYFVLIGKTIKLTQNLPADAGSNLKIMYMHGRASAKSRLCTSQLVSGPRIRFGRRIVQPSKLHKKRNLHIQNIHFNF